MWLTLVEHESAATMQQLRPFFAPTVSEGYVALSEDLMSVLSKNRDSMDLEYVMPRLSVFNREEFEDIVVGPQSDNSTRKWPTVQKNAEAVVKVSIETCAIHGLGKADQDLVDKLSRKPFPSTAAPFAIHHQVLG